MGKAKGEEEGITIMITYTCTSAVCAPIGRKVGHKGCAPHTSGTLTRSYFLPFTYLLRVFHPLITDVHRCIAVIVVEESMHVIHVSVRVIVRLKEPVCIVQVRPIDIVERLKGFRRQIFTSVSHSDVYRWK